MGETRLVSHTEATRVLRAAGYSKDQIDEVLRDFPDPIDLEHAREKLLRHGISVGTLMDRRGASP